MRLLRLIAAVLFTALLGVSAPQAATEAKFDQAGFAAAQAAGKPILVAVHADWCPTCAKQKPILEKLTAAPAMQDLVVFVVDFDTQKDVLRAMHVQVQSTLIVFKGKVEQDRATGITSEAAIKALLDKTRG